MASDVAPLACPSCGTNYPPDERFCSICGIPLTYEGEIDVEQPGSKTQQQARKIKPQYARGDLRRVATARHLAEAEFIQNMLLEEGVPSSIQRAVWDVPELLAAGPRSILVPESGYQLALQVLQRSEAEVELEAEQAKAAMPSPTNLLIVIVLIAGLVALYILIAAPN